MTERKVALASLAVKFAGRAFASFARWGGRLVPSSSERHRRTRAMRLVYLSLLSGPTLVLLCSSLLALAQEPSPVPKHVGIILPTEVPPGWGSGQWRISRSICQEIADRSAAHLPIRPEVAREYKLCQSLSFQFDPKNRYPPPGSSTAPPADLPQQSHGPSLPTPVATAGAGSRVPAQ